MGLNAANEWDYTDLAKAYLKRPGYCEAVVDQCFAKAGIEPGMKGCDVGAGTGNLTVLLVRRGLNVVAIEPNPAMRVLGEERTADLPRLVWRDGRAEASGQPPGNFHLVAFGSSFNVVERGAALEEASRILKRGGWFVCLWNHRDLDDPLQRSIEDLIHSHLPGYQYGVRHEDQEGILQGSGLFDRIERIEGTFLHTSSVEDCVEAWRSHATLRRQAGSRFEAILQKIEQLLSQSAQPLQVPYTTRLWMARKHAPCKGDRFSPG